ncbi:acetyl-CoA carboxylase biotin carboxyl carrier protein [Ramlibacter solisilvae]|nr:biotin/lipoyl-containing protein [Ramlibacter tataouinensis]
MPLTHSDVRSLLDILDRSEGLESLDIKLGDFVLRARKHGAAPLATVPIEIPAPSARPVEPAPPAATPGAAAGAEVPVTEVPAGMTAIRAPMLGTFYCKPSPEQPAYVQEGAAVALDQTVCLVEVMKMFNTVKAPVAGRVRRILAEHGKLVQHDQILMLIEG